jgi:hypothetical protein
VDSVFFRINRRECFLGYHPEIHSRTENALRGPIHPTAKASGLSRPNPVRFRRMRFNGFGNRPIIALDAQSAPQPPHRDALPSL